ncbi:MAG: carbohydrate binding domain-containing protein [Flavobacteriales bacterium]|nr:carbohydrate binding domain-containing protein [Flavobacteriales bacterium]
MRKALLLPMIALAGTLQAQTVFTSDLEGWTNNLPDGWVGSKTNINTDSIFQTANNPHGGTYAVELHNTTPHKRFTTQPVAVTSGTSYTISFWVRGQGQVRTGLFDGRPGGSSGYAPYNAYVTVSSNSWQQVTQTVTCAYDTTGGEFILSVLSTIAPDHLVIDDVNIEVAGPPAPTSIFDIQFTTDPNGASPVTNQGVLTGGRVVGVVTGAGYYLQSGTGAWSGIYVVDAVNAVNRGDSVTLGATVEESFGFTRLNNVTGFTVVNSGNPDPAVTNVSTAQANTEPFESVVCKVTNVPCVVAPNQFGEWKLFDTDSLYVDDQMFAYTPAVGTSYNVTGPLFYSFGRYKMEPRDANDVEVANSIEEGLFATATVGPVPTSDLLNIDLGALAGSRVEYTLSDLTGRSLLNGLLTNGRSTLDLSMLPAGGYLLTLRTNEAAKAVKVLVQH